MLPLAVPASTAAVAPGVGRWTSRTRRVVLAAALFASGCEGDGEEAIRVGVDKPPDPGKATTRPEEPEPTPVVLENGFVPDPHVVEGEALGTRDAASLGESCSGFIGTAPDHLLETRGTFAELRVLATSPQDVTLVIERADGSHLCADDTHGTDPAVVATFPAGLHGIWVGTTRPEVAVSYRLGFSELADVTPSSLDRREAAPDD